MSKWRVRVRGSSASLFHENDVEAGLPAWSGVVELWQGGSTLEGETEFFHAFMSIELAPPHREYVRHRWVYDLPATWGASKNTGEERRYMTLKSVDGPWSLVLKFPAGTPPFVFAAVALDGFRAELVQPARQPEKRKAMKPAGPDQVPKPGSMGMGTVPTPSSPPDDCKDGMNSIKSPA